MHYEQKSKLLLSSFPYNLTAQVFLNQCENT